MSEQAHPFITVHRLVSDAAAKHSERIAVSDGDLSLSYAELNEQRLQAARALHALGLRKGERIAVWAPNMYQWIVASLGAQTLGGILVPLNTRLKGPEAGYILRASAARWLFTVPDFIDICYPALLEKEELPDLEGMVMCEGSYPGCESWDAFMAQGDSVALEEVEAIAEGLSPEDTLDILFTSGTTGKPKGVMTGHGQNIRTYSIWAETVGLRADDNYLIINPFFHSFGYKAGWLAAITRGSRILPVRSFDIDQVLAQIERDKVSMIPGPPTIYQSLLAHPRRDEFDLSSLRLAVTGAAPVPVKLVEQMREVLGFDVVVTAYGLTESSGVVAICRPEDSAERISHTSGRAIPGVEMKCVDAGGETLAPGEEGEIWVRGFNVMHAYLDNPEETARAITDEGWLKTGDVGVMDAEGYVRITDRVKDMFIVGGFNCYPAEIENILCDMPGVARAAVIGIPDERMGEVAMAFVVPEAGAALDEAQVIAWSRNTMANFKVPRRVAFVEAFPMNAGGKVLKNELRKAAAAQEQAQ